MTKLALTVRELQEATGLGRQSAYNLARRLGVRVNKRWIVSVVRLEEFLAGEREP